MKSDTFVCLKCEEEKLVRIFSDKQHEDVIKQIKKFCCIHFKVAPGGPSQMSQKRAADGDAGQYGQQGPPAYYDANKRLRY